MNELALFAGAGGGILAGKLLGWRTVCAVEIDPYCRRVLMQRQSDGVLKPFPIWDDVRTFDGYAWRGKVDVVTAGFPCQPFSSAGQRKGHEDERNLWPETIRIVREVRPRFAMLENVPGLLSICDGSGRPYYGRILADISEGGMDARWCIASAADVGAPHLRRRLWIHCDANGNGKSVVPEHAEASGVSGNVADAQEQPERAGLCEGESERRRGRRLGDSDSEIADAAGEGLAQRQGGAGDDGTQYKAVERSSWWHAEPDVGRVADGVASRVERLRALGNGQVPAVVRRAWELLNVQ